MKESLFYRGHHIVVKAVEHVFGKWCWTYTIDEKAAYTDHGPFHGSKLTATEAALENAKARVDRGFDGGQPGKT